MSLPKIDIDNVIAVASDDAEQRQAAYEAVQALAAEAGSQVLSSDNRVFFHTEWEPPLKALKKLSKAMPAVTFSLWADAFKAHHWICKVEFVAGKGEEETLSRIDDEFPAVFKEIFGCDESAWQKDQKQPFMAWFAR